MAVFALFPLDDMESGTVRKVAVGHRDIALVRIGDDVYALGDTCSHAEVSLSEGFVEAEDCTIECARHGALFDLRTGTPVSLPATRPVPVYDVAVVDGQVQLTIDEGPAIDGDPALHEEESA